MSRHDVTTSNVCSACFEFCETADKVSGKVVNIRSLCYFCKNTSSNFSPPPNQEQHWSRHNFQKVKKTKKNKKVSGGVRTGDDQPAVPESREWSECVPGECHCSFVVTTVLLTCVYWWGGTFWIATSKDLVIDGVKSSTGLLRLLRSDSSALTPPLPPPLT